MNLSNKRVELFGLLIALFSVAGSVIWIRTATVKETYSYVQKEKQLKQTEIELQTLRMKWLKLTSPKQLEILAKNAGLEPPKLSQTVRYTSKAP